MKTCTACKQDKALTEFRKCGKKQGRLGVRPLCKVCQRGYEKTWRSQSKERRAASRARRREKAKAYATGYILKNRAAYLVAECRRRSARKGLAFNLSLHVAEIQTRIDKGACEVSGAPLKKTLGPMTFDSPSIDRIDPKQGYVYANIRIVCRLMNCAMGDWGEATLRAVMGAWLAKE